MKLLIIEGADLASIYHQFNSLVEAGTVADPVEYGYTRETKADGTPNIVFTLFYK